jgi:hypothetical protein
MSSQTIPAGETCVGLMWKIRDRVDDFALDLSYHNGTTFVAIPTTGKTATLATRYVASWATLTQTQLDNLYIEIAASSLAKGETAGDIMAIECYPITTKYLDNNVVGSIGLLSLGVDGLAESVSSY